MQRISLEKSLLEKEIDIHKTSIYHPESNRMDHIRVFGRYGTSILVRNIPFHDSIGATPWEIMFNKRMSE